MSYGLGYPFGQFGSALPGTSLQPLTCPQPGRKRERAEMALQYGQLKLYMTN